MTTERQAIEVMRQADACDDCFVRDRSLARAACDVPQPRWIGPRYFAARPRVAVVLINPGGGGSSADTAALNEEATVFRDFHRTGDYKPIRSYFERCLARRDKWLWRYRELFGLDHDEIAQLNIAWCATENNIYPSSMQDHCFERHTAALLRALDPHVVILSGGVSQPDRSRTRTRTHSLEGSKPSCPERRLFPQSITRIEDRGSPKKRRHVGWPSSFSQRPPEVRVPGRTRLRAPLHRHGRPCSAGSTATACGRTSSGTSRRPWPPRRASRSPRTWAGTAGRTTGRRSSTSTTRARATARRRRRWRTSSSCPLPHRARRRQMMKRRTPTPGSEALSARGRGRGHDHHLSAPVHALGVLEHLVEG